jgi:hypothetical protein
MVGIVFGPQAIADSAQLFKCSGCSLIKDAVRPVTRLGTLT